ncbi:MAG: hypothetical protein ACJ735_03865 [Actinomycetes bacterium]
MIMPSYDATLYDWRENEETRSRTKRERRRRRGRRVAGVAIALTCLSVVAYNLLPVSWYSQRAYDRKYGFGPYENRLLPGTRAALARDVKDLQTFVEQQRGGTYRHPVSVEFLPDKQFRQALGDDRGSASDEDIALGLAPNASALANETRELDGSVTGFYDDRSGKLYVRGQTLDDEARITLVHELTHAYDDQHFNLTRFDDTDDNDADAAELALVEGDAVAVESSYLETLPIAVRCPGLEDAYQAYDSDCRAAGYREDAVDDASADALEAEDDFPYAIGGRFIATLRRLGGPNAVNKAFGDPPVDTAQVIDISTYLSHRRPVGVRYPTPPGVASVRHVHVGALRLSAIVSNGKLGPGLRGYVRGWRGDSGVTFTRNRRQCLDDRVVLSDSVTAATLIGQLTTWRARRTDRSFRRESPITVLVERCGT